MANIVRCFQYRLRPTPEQERQFRQWAGCRRLIWNYFRERRQAHYRETGKSLSYAAMCQELTLLKQQEEYAFLNDCDSQALQQVLKDLCTAYTNFFEGRARFPRRKSRKRTPNAFRIPQRVKLEGAEVSIPKVGKVSLVLHRSIEGEVKSATIKQEASGKWTISFVCHCDAPDLKTGEPSSPLGLDAGLESFLTGRPPARRKDTSDGEKVAPPRFYRKQERKLARAQRQCARKKKGSRNRDKARKRVAVVHARTRHQRADWLHKLSRRLCDKHDVICIEDLAISALTKTGRPPAGKDSCAAIARVGMTPVGETSGVNSNISKKNKANALWLSPVGILRHRNVMSATIVPNTNCRCVGGHANIVVVSMTVTIMRHKTSCAKD